jgi:septum formation protein
VPDSPVPDSPMPDSTTPESPPGDAPVRLYLASTSPARLATLRAAGIEPVVVPSSVDEDAAVAAAGPLTPVEMVLLLARLKASAVLSAEIDGFVLGGDSAFELDGIVYGKPHRPEVARERWMLQRGRTGHLHSGHWLIDHRGGVARGEVGDVATAGVTFASDISDREIDAYISTGEPLEVAGAFTIDSLGAPFITSVEGDPHAVVGLSLSTLRSLLRQFDVHWPSLWNR